MSLHRSFTNRLLKGAGTLASLLLTAVAVALALGSSTAALANDPSLRPDTAPSALQDDATRQDSDSDGLTDAEEIRTYRTNPLHPDSDRDGVSDGDEVIAHRSNPLGADTDGDGLLDGEELRFGTDILHADTDGDGLDDGAEIALDADPFAADSDSDGIVDGTEVRELGSSPVATDSDGDGLDDGDEVARFNTNPAKADNLEVFTYTPAGTGNRVPTTSVANERLQPLQIADATTTRATMRIPLMPAPSMPVLQVHD